VIDDSAFAPALNTMTNPALPLAPEVPALQPMAKGLSPAAAEQVSSSVAAAVAAVAPIKIMAAQTPIGVAVAVTVAGVPSPLPHTASRDAVIAENKKLRELLEAAQYQMEKDHALKVLMNKENDHLREAL
jgi:hypothetical protein